MVRLMKKLTCHFVSLLFLCTSLSSQNLNLDSGLVASYPLKGKKRDNGIQVSVDVNPDSYPELTITAWVRADKTFGHAEILTSGEKERCRGLVIDRSHGDYCWSANCGKGGVLNGPLVTTEKVFMAVLYDQLNEAVRLIVDNRVYAGRGKMGACSNGLSSANFEGDVTDVRIYGRLLTIPELEAVSGSGININTDDFPIRERYAYKKKREEAKLADLKENPVRLTYKSKFRIYAGKEDPNVKAYLEKGDTVVILELEEEWARVGYNGEKTGYISQRSLHEYTYPADGSGLLFTLKYTLRNLFQFSSLRSWIIVILCAGLLFLAFRYYYRIERFFWRFGEQDNTAMGASRSDSDAYKKPFLKRFFTYYRYRWWPLTIGMIAAISLLIGGLWDGTEMEWYLAEGINLVPVGLDRAVHWFLYIMTLVIFLMTLVMIVESFVMCGWKGGTMRVVFLVIVNLLAFLVFFYLFIVFITGGVLVLGFMFFTGSFKRDTFSLKK